MAAHNRALPYLLGVIATVLVGWVLYVAADILQPLVIAAMLCTVLQPVVRVLAKVHIPPALTVISLVSLLGWGLFNVGVRVDENVRSFLGAYGKDPAPAPAPTADGDATVFDWDMVVTSIEVRLSESDLPEAVRQNIVNTIRDVDIAGLAADLLGGGIDFVRGLFMVVLYMLFIFAEQAVFRRKILHVSGEGRSDAARTLARIGGGIQRYLVVKTVASFFTGLLCYSALVWQEVPYPLLFGFLTYLLNYIPTFGSIFAGILAAITALAAGDVSTALIVASVYLGVNITIGSYLEPKVLGHQLNLSPLVVIVSVVVWASLWGVMGGFLAVPLTSTIQIVLASRPTTHPIAVLLSSGPPQEETGLRARVRGRRSAREAAS